jgi:hypothetical protein
MTEVNNAEDTAPTKSVEDLLDSMKGQLENCIITGFNAEGNLVMSSSIPNVPYMHWTLNRSLFELNLFEKQSASQQETPESVDTEASEE